MARRSMVSADSRWRMGNSTERTNGSHQRQVDNSAELEHRFFEYDRRIISGAVKALRESVQEGALQLEMCAAERMFDDTLSASLSRTSRKLERINRALESILLDIAKATGYPDIAVRSPISRDNVRLLANRSA